MSGFKCFACTQTDLRRHRNTWKDTTGDPLVYKNTSYTDMETKLHTNAAVHVYNTFNTAGTQAVTVNCVIGHSLE